MILKIEFVNDLAFYYGGYIYAIFLVWKLASYISNDL